MMQKDYKNMEIYLVYEFCKNIWGFTIYMYRMGRSSKYTRFSETPDSCFMLSHGPKKGVLGFGELSPLYLSGDETG